MQLAKAGQICNVCQPNALMTLLEYAIDYGDGEFKEMTAKLLEIEVEKISNGKIKKKSLDYISRIKNGERDFRF